MYFKLILCIYSIYKLLIGWFKSFSKKKDDLNKLYNKFVTLTYIMFILIWHAWLCNKKKWHAWLKDPYLIHKE